MTTIRLLILDVDGTIAGLSNAVSPRVVEAIQKVQERGIKVAIATGRMYCSASRFQQQIRTLEPLIAYNGAWIQQPGKIERLLHRPVPRDRVAELLEFAQEATAQAPLEVHLYSDDQLFVAQVTSETKAYVGRSGIPANAVGDLRTLLDRDLTKVLMLSPDPEHISTLQQQFRERYTPEDVHITQSTATYLEFTQPYTNKGTAVTYLAQDHYQFDLGEVMAIGDNFNDLEMLQTVGLGVAMGNAPDGVKEVAKWVTESVDEDGVAVAIERFLLA
jgi:hypothetical protein